MFNSFSFSELLTILFVIVIVFGPNRLPEMARKLGQWTARARRSLDSLKSEIGTDYQDVIEPIKGARDDLRGLRQEIRDTAKSVVSDLDEAAADVRKLSKDEKASDAAATPPSGSAPSDDEAKGRPSSGSTSPDASQEEDAS